jgi:hypothetical protein
MAKLITVGIDLSKINKSKITEKNGAKWYNITISVNDTKDQYGNDTGVYETQSKEEREAKAKKVYLGNGKTVWEGSSTKPTTSIESVIKEMQAEKDTINNPEISDNLPF